MDDLLAELSSLFESGLTSAQLVIIGSDRRAVDPAMEVDDFLQFTLLNGQHIPSELLDRIESFVRQGWDPEIEERTLSWIQKHRQVS